MSHIKLVVAVALALLIAIVFAGWRSGSAVESTDQAAASVSGTLRIGVTGAEPTYYEVDGMAKGFDYQMARGVAEGMGVEPEFVEMDYSDLFTALRDGKIDMIGSQVTKSPEGEHGFDFSSPYFVTYVSFLAPRGSDIRTRGDVEGKRVAVVAGTIHERYLAKEYDHVRVVRVKDEDAAVEAIATDRADAFFYGAPYAKSIMKRAPIQLTEPIVYQASEAPIGFVVREGDERKKQIDGALEDMILSGAWLKIKTDYFDDRPLSEVFREKGV